MRACLTAVLLATLALAPLTASPGPAHAQTASEQTLARQLFRQGVAAAREERWVDAVDAFQRSFELAQRPLTLLNLAGALVHAGRLVEGAEAYRMFLADAGSGPAQRLRADAETALREVEARIPSVRLRVDGFGDGDVVTLDEYELSRAAVDQWLPVDPGAHTATVTRAGAEPRVVPFEVEEATRQEIVIDLGPTIARTDAETRVDASLVSGVGATTDASTQGGGRSVLEEPALWIVVGGVVLAGAGIAIGVALGTQPGPVYVGNLPPFQVGLE